MIVEQSTPDQNESPRDTMAEHARLRVLYHAGLLQGEKYPYTPDEIQDDLIRNNVDLRLPTAAEFSQVAQEEVSVFAEQVNGSKILSQAVLRKEGIIEGMISKVEYQAELYEMTEKAERILAERDIFVGRFMGTGLVPSTSDTLQFEEFQKSMKRMYSALVSYYSVDEGILDVPDLKKLVDHVRILALRQYASLITTMQDVISFNLHSSIVNQKLYDAFEDFIPKRVVETPETPETTRAMMDGFANWVLAQQPVDPEAAFSDSTATSVPIWGSLSEESVARLRREGNSHQDRILTMLEARMNEEVPIDDIAAQLFPENDGGKARSTVSNIIYLLRGQGFAIENTAKSGSRAVYVLRSEDDQPTEDLGSAFVPPISDLDSADSIMPVIPAAAPDPTGSTESPEGFHDDGYAQCVNTLPDGKEHHGLIALILSGTQNDAFTLSEVVGVGYGVSEAELRTRVKEFNDAGHGYRLDGVSTEDGETIYHLVEFTPIPQTVETVFQNLFPVSSDGPLTHADISRQFTGAQSGPFEELVSAVQARFQVSADSAARLVYGIVLKNNLMKANWVRHVKGSKRSLNETMNSDVGGVINGAIETVGSKIDAMEKYGDR